MVRAYQPGRDVPAELRERLLRHAQRAPSAGFARGCAYVVLESPQEREGFWAATAGAREQGEWLARMREAPLLITCWCSERIYRERYAETDKTGADPFSAPYWYVDAGMGVLLMLQTAVDEGLSRAEEEWTVIVVTDHGHLDEGHHGGDSDEERSAWIAAAGPGIGADFGRGVDHADIPVHILRRLDVPIDPAWQLDGVDFGQRP